MVAGELTHLAREQSRAVGKEDLRFADPARVQQKVARRRVARVVLVADLEGEVAERDPGRLAAPPRLDDLGLQREHRLERRAGLRRETGLEARPKAQPRDPYVDVYARDPAGEVVVWLRVAIENA